MFEPKKACTISVTKVPALIRVNALNRWSESHFTMRTNTYQKYNCRCERCRKFHVKTYPKKLFKERSLLHRTFV